jgi:hypothetical protein
MTNRVFATMESPGGILAHHHNICFSVTPALLHPLSYGVAQTTRRRRQADATTSTGGGSDRRRQRRVCPASGAATVGVHEQVDRGCRRWHPRDWGHWWTGDEGAWRWHRIPGTGEPGRGTAAQRTGERGAWRWHQIPGTGRPGRGTAAQRMGDGSSGAELGHRSWRKEMVSPPAKYVEEGDCVGGVRPRVVSTGDATVATR